MICPECGRAMKVGRTEQQAGGRLIIRWRYCECGNSERTEERPKTIPAPRQEEILPSREKPF